MVTVVVPVVMVSIVIIAPVVMMAVMAEVRLLDEIRFRRTGARIAHRRGSCLRGDCARAEHEGTNETGHQSLARHETSFLDVGQRRGCAVPISNQ